MSIIYLLKSKYLSLEKEKRNFACNPNKEQHMPLQKNLDLIVPMFLCALYSKIFIILSDKTMHIWLCT